MVGFIFRMAKQIKNKEQHIEDDLIREVELDQFEERLIRLIKIYKLTREEKKEMFKGYV